MISHPVIYLCEFFFFLRLLGVDAYHVPDSMFNSHDLKVKSSLMDTTENPHPSVPLHTNGRASTEVKENIPVHYSRHNEENHKSNSKC